MNTPGERGATCEHTPEGAPVVNEPVERNTRMHEHSKAAKQTPLGDMTGPSYPRRYQADRTCLQCARVVRVTVCLLSPDVIGYRCGRDHLWFAVPPEAAL